MVQLSLLLCVSAVGLFCSLDYQHEDDGKLLHALFILNKYSSEFRVLHIKSTRTHRQLNVKHLLSTTLLYGAVS